MQERHGDLSVIAGRSVSNEVSRPTQELINEIATHLGAYDVIEITDLAGTVILESNTDVKVDPSGAEWFRAAASGQAVTASPTERDGQIDWAIAEPILGQDGTPEGVVVGYLQTTLLAELLNPELANGTAVVAVDADRHLVYDTAMGKVADDAALLSAGSLSTTVENVAVDRALAGQLGSASFTDLHGDAVIGGYDIVDELGWAMIAQDPRDATLAPVTAQRNRALALIVLGAVFAVGFAIVFARWITRPLRALTSTAVDVAGGRLDVRVVPEGSTEMVVLGTAFNSMLETSERLVKQMVTAGVEVNSAAAELSASPRPSSKNSASKGDSAMPSALFAASTTFLPVVRR